MTRFIADSLRPGFRNGAARRYLAGCFLLGLAMFLLAAPARADDDLPGRVGRVADMAGELFLSPPDAPEQWLPIGINYPVTGGDNLWVGNDSRAEVDFGAGQFRLAGNTNLHLSRLDDRQFALFVAQGRVSVRIRVLDAGEIARVDTPNVQIVLTRPGLYRIDVSDDRLRTILAVREGEGNVLMSAGIQQVLPGQTAEAEGSEPRFAAVRNGVSIDGFDAWVGTRDRRYERNRPNNYVSREMVGWADLDEHGTWAQVPEMGAVWYPTDVAPDWAPYRNGYWAQVGGWGPTWVDYAPWGYAPFHYGRWAFVGGRWGWAPGTYVARPFWAPALVGWTGGAAWSFSVSSGAPVYGWVPLAWGEPYRPWWGRCSHGCWQRYNRPYAVDVTVRPSAPPPRYVNVNAPGGMTAMPATALIERRPVAQHMVSVSGGMAAQAPLLLAAPIVRSDVGRIPVPRAPVGAPPPASTFYRTGSNPSGGLGSLQGAGAPTAVPPAARPAPSSGLGGINAAPPSSRPAPAMGMAAPAPSAPATSGLVAPLPPSMQRTPSRPAPSAPAYVAPTPTVVAPAMPSAVRQAPAPVSAPQAGRPAPVPQAAPAASPPAVVPAPAPTAAPAGSNLQRSERQRPDRVDGDKPPPR